MIIAVYFVTVAVKKLSFIFFSVVLSVKTVGILYTSTGMIPWIP